MTTTTAPASSAVPRGNLATRMLRQLGADSAYTIVGLPIGVVGFVVVFTLFVTGLSLAVLVIGVPVLVGAVYAARGFADIERLRLPAVLHRPPLRPRYRQPEAGAATWRRIVSPLRDAQSWLDLLHAIIGWIVAIVTFVLVVTWWSVALSGLTSIIWDRYIPHGANNQDLNVLLGLADTPATRVGLQTVIGLGFLITLPLVARVCALLQGHLAHALLVGIAEIQNRISGLEERRAAAVSAEATALRRLERDIHDGPQQRLVRLAMDLGRAGQQLDHDPAAARVTLAEALGQTRETLDELRALSRGIAPPILADRGLPSALAALAGRCTVPVSLTVDPALGRLTPLVENTAYFLVAEALTNVAKHSGATACLLSVRRHADRLVVDVVDNGVGGALPAPGHGLAGLADRVRATNGELTVDSPTGGPTRLHADLPCG